MAGHLRLLFLFDFGSPTTYLAHKRLPQLRSWVHLHHQSPRCQKKCSCEQVLRTSLCPMFLHLPHPQMPQYHGRPLRL